MNIKSSLNKKLGAWGESYAARLYLRKGFKLLISNSFNRTGKQFGEIDLVMIGRHQIIFVEVKTRVSNYFGLPEEAISAHKRARLIKIVTWFLARNPQYQLLQPRIDICAIMMMEVAKTLPTSDLDKFVKYSKIITNAVELN